MVKQMVCMCLTILLNQVLKSLNDNSVVKFRKSLIRFCGCLLQKASVLMHKADALYERLRFFF